jgi:16S rRNA processing protein RimM
MSGGRICVGALAGAFGVKGEVRVKSFCAEPEAIADYSPLTTEDGRRSFALRLTRPIPGGFAAQIEGVTTREAAEALRGVRLHAAREALPSLPDDEFYHADLIGLEVRDPGGASLGTVLAVHNHGAGDLLEIRVPGARSTVLLPFTREAVPMVDLASGRLVADPPDGVFGDAGEPGDGARDEGTSP